jgi:hypothetical protein
MTQALTTTDEQRALQAQIEALGGLGVAGEQNLEQGDVGMPPRLRISQPNRPIKVGDDPVPAGAFVNSVTNEVYHDGLEIVPLVFLPRTRVKWPERFSADNDPECASDDGKTPSLSSDMRKLNAPMSGPCADCPSAKFSEDSTPPSCKVQRNFLVWLLDSSEPAILTMQSTALSSARALTTLAKTQGLTKSVMLITQKQSDNRGEWYIPATARGRKLEAHELLAVAEARNELENLVITADVEVAGDVEGDPHGGAPGENDVDGGELLF